MVQCNHQYCRIQQTAVPRRSVCTNRGPITQERHKRPRGYAARLCSISIAVITLVAVSQSFAGVIHIDPDPDFEANLVAAQSGSKTVVLDMIPNDGVWTDELTFELSKLVTIGTGKMSINTSGQIAVSASAGVYVYGIKHSHGESIDASLHFSNDTTTAKRYGESRPTLPNDWYYGNFFAAGYLGLQIKDDLGDSHYGWAHVTVDLNDLEVVVHEWAYNSQAGVPIEAGHVPEPATLTLFSFGGLMMLRRRRRRRC